MFAWTDERIEALKTDWADGFSAREIISKNKWDVSRNAILGKVHRLRMKSRPTTHAAPRKERKPAQKLERAKQRSEPPPPAPNPSRPVTLMQLTDEHCRWPIGDPQDKDFHFCGARPLLGQPYCDEHCRMAYNAPAARPAQTYYWNKGAA